MLGLQASGARVPAGARSASGAPCRDCIWGSLPPGSWPMRSSARGRQGSLGLAVSCTEGHMAHPPGSGSGPLCSPSGVGWGLVLSPHLGKSRRCPIPCLPDTLPSPGRSPSLNPLSRPIWEGHLFPARAA